MRCQKLHKKTSEILICTLMLLACLAAPVCPLTAQTVNRSIGPQSNFAINDGDSEQSQTPRDTPRQLVDYFGGVGEGKSPAALTRGANEGAMQRAQSRLAFLPGGGAQFLHGLPDLVRLRIRRHRLAIADRDGKGNLTRQLPVESALLKTEDASRRRRD